MVIFNMWFQHVMPCQLHMWWHLSTWKRCVKCYWEYFIFKCIMDINSTSHRPLQVLSSSLFVDKNVFRMLYHGPLDNLGLNLTTSWPSLYQANVSSESIRIQVRPICITTPPCKLKNAVCIFPHMMLVKNTCKSYLPENISLFCM